MFKISVIVLTFNAPLEKILLTLKSVVMQNFDGYEIIISDDGSKYKFFREIEEFFSKYNFTNYLIIANPVNKGTVINYLGALEKANGKYVKPIGAGDLLHNEFALKKIYDFMEKNHYPIGFGLMESYMLTEDGKYRSNCFSAPIDIKPYANQNLEAIRKRMICNGDYISGSTFFGEKSFIKKYLNIISDFVTLTEDIIQILIVLDNIVIPVLEEKIIYYEIGTGVSTKRTKSLHSPLSNDHLKFWVYVKNNSNSKKIIKQATHNIKILNERNIIKKKILLLLLRPGEFICNLIRKNKRKHFNSEIADGFLADK